MSEGHPRPPGVHGHVPLLQSGSQQEYGPWVLGLAETSRIRPSPQPGDLPMGPRLGPAAELCGGGWPTSWLTEGSLPRAPCDLLMDESTGP